MTDLGIPGYNEAEVIGRGGFATVYKAQRQRFGDCVAIKLIDSVPDERALRRVDRELQAVGKVAGHRNIVAVYDADRRDSDGRPYIVMELVPGGTLSERVRRKGPLPWAEVAEIGVVLADALQWAHDRGVIHRDVKPENVLVDDRFADTRDRIRLTDFGVAAIEGRTLTSEAWSVAHAAPEAILDGAPPTTKADLYGLASTLYQLLDGDPPFVREDDETLGQVFARIQVGAIGDLRPKGVPDPVASVIEQGLERDPSQRPDTAADFAALLTAAADEVAEAARATDAARAAEMAEGARAEALVSDASKGLRTRRQGVTALPGRVRSRTSQLSTVERVIVMGGGIFGVVALALLLTGLIFWINSGEGERTSSTATSPSSSSTSAAPTTTAGLAPRSIFTDDFSVYKPGWPLNRNDANVRMGPVDEQFQVVAKVGRLSFDIPAPVLMLVMTGERTRTEVDATLVSQGSSGLAGITCRHSGNGYYYGWVGVDGYWRIGRTGLSDPLRSALPSTYVTGLDPALPIRIGMECSGETSVAVKLFVNGKEVASATDDAGFEQAGFGLVVMLDNPGEWRFDNFAVSTF